MHSFFRSVHQVIFFAVFFAIVGWVRVRAAAGEVPAQAAWLDQKQELSNAVNSGVKTYWQEFVPDVDYIDRVELRVAEVVNPRLDIVGKIVVTLESQDGTVLATAERVASEIIEGGWCAFEFKTFVSKGGSYRFRMTSQVEGFPLVAWSTGYSPTQEDLYPRGDSSLSSNGVRRDSAFRVLGVDTTATPEVRQLANISLRRVLDGSESTIVGFVVDGPGPRQLLVRGVGASLAGFGVPNVMPDPRLTLFNSAGVALDENDNAVLDTHLVAATQASGAFALTSDKDAAKLVTLSPGAYTVHVRSANGVGGDVLAEVYDVTGLFEGSLAEDYASKVVNLSSLALLSSTEQLAVGFVARSDRKHKVLLRVVGPTLAQFQVSDVLPDPEFVFYRSGNAIPIVLVDDFSGGIELSQAVRKAGAFATTSEKEAVILWEIEPGAYTMLLNNHPFKPNGSGRVLVEIYDVTELTF